MNSNILYRCALLGLLTLVSSSIWGQVNIKVGYGLGFPSLTSVDALLNSYQPDGGEVTEGFGSLSFTHGIQLGLRYKIANTGLELGWETMSRDRSALVYQPSSDSFSDRTYRFGISSYHLGIEHYFDRYGLGAAIHSQKLGIKRPIGNNDLSLVNERKLAVRLQFIWKVQQSDLVSLMIKPYYQIPFGDYNLGRFADDVEASDVREDALSMIGLSLVFYNGRQED